MKDKKYYEQKINESPCFSIDKQEDPYTYEREKNKLVELLYQYKRLESSKYDAYGVELMETVRDCLRSYNKEYGPFTKYFNKALAQRIKKADLVEEIAINNGGMHLFRSDYRAVSMIAGFLKAHPEVTPEQLLLFKEKYQDQINMSADDIEKGAFIYQDARAIYADSYVADDSDEEYTFFDRIPSKTDFTSDYDDACAAAALIDRCESEYLMQTEKVQDALAMKLTSILACWDKNREYSEYIKRKAFFNETAYEQVQKTGKEMLDIEICRLTGKSRSNFSQIWKRFMVQLNSSNTAAAM